MSVSRKLITGGIGVGAVTTPQSAERYVITNDGFRSRDGLDDWLRTASGVERQSLLCFRNVMIEMRFF